MKLALSRSAKEMAIYTEGRACPMTHRREGLASVSSIPLLFRRSEGVRAKRPILIYDSQGRIDLTYIVCSERPWTSAHQHGMRRGTIKVVDYNFIYPETPCLFHSCARTLISNFQLPFQSSITSLLSTGVIQSRDQFDILIARIQRIQGCLVT